MQDDVGERYEFDDDATTTSASLVQPAHRRDDGQRFVVKACRAQYPTAEDLARLRHEFNVLGLLADAPVAHAVELVRFGHGQALILEQARGSSLDQIIAQGRPDLERFLQIAICATTALEAVHAAGVLHKDLKPHHIFIDGQLATLIDFGLAVATAQEALQPIGEGVLAGTLEYIAPEQTGRLNRCLDERTDLYSLGVTLYQLLTGSLPFESKDPLELVHAHVARTPVAPQSLCPELPSIVSDLIMRLLNKAAERRYQTASGLKADLQRCAEQWSAARSIEPFELGQDDYSGQLRLPQTLYAREQEAQTLRAAYERVRSGSRESVLVTGSSGMGKSALIEELRSELAQRGTFISGKFEHSNRSIPYSALAYACTELVRAQLTKAPEKLELWASAMREALGQHAQVVIEVVPELQLVLGEQPQLPPLGPTEAQGRFERMFRRFLEVSASAESPVILFLDDLQWADDASLDLLQLFMSNREQKHLLLIGSYRDSDVDEKHPLSECVAVIKQSCPTHHLALEPLPSHSVHAFVKEALPRCEGDSEALAHVLGQKTSGNPFFLRQFLRRLVRDEHLRFNKTTRAWQWDLAQLESLSVTDNVVDLVLDRLAGLSSAAQNTLRRAACIGDRFSVSLLRTVVNEPLSDVARALRESVHAGFAAPLEAKSNQMLDQLCNPNHDDAEHSVPSQKNSSVELHYRFSHDRIRQAAYAMLPEADRELTHLHIARRLLSLGGSNTGSAQDLFAIVSQYNLGRCRIDEAEERKLLADLNLKAALRAKSANAVSSARELAATTCSLLGQDCWATDYATAHQASVLLAECHYLSTDYDQAYAVIEAIDTHAKTALDRIPALNLKTTLQTTEGLLAQATATSLSAMRLLGSDIPDPSDREALGAAIGAAFGAYQAGLADREIGSLVDLPAMDDPEKLALINTYAGAIPAAFQTDPELMALIVLKGVRLPLDYGTAPISSFFYEQYGIVHTIFTSDHDRAYQFGLLGIELSQRPEQAGARGGVHFIFATFLSPWRRPIGESFQHHDLGIRQGLDAGDQLHAAYSMSLGAIYRLYAGNPLSAISATAAGSVEALTRSHDVMNLDFLRVLTQTIACLEGRTASFGSLDDDSFNETEFESATAPPVLAPYGCHKAMLRYLAGQAEEALQASEQFRPLPLMYYNAEYAFYRALAALEVARDAKPERRAALLADVAQEIEKFDTWQRSCPQNFAHRHQLLLAEQAVVQGRVEDALRHFESATEESANVNPIHHLALANERCGRFHQRAGRKKVAHTYLLDARYQYEQWGALAKASALDEEFPELAPSDAAAVFTSIQHRSITKGRSAHTATVGGENLDLMSAMRATHAMASELELRPLVKRLMAILVENACAKRGILVLPTADGLVLSSVLTVDPDGIELDLTEPLQHSARLPASIVQLCARSKETVVIDDASRDSRFGRDPFIVEHRPKSVMCLPLVHQGQLSALLYLDSTVAAGVFHPGRIERLQFLASHAAVALKNATLYAQIQAATERLRVANETLETRVQERTAELRGRNADMRRVLDNVVQGLVTVDLNGQLASERSAVIDAWFGTPDRHASFSEYMRPSDADFAARFSLGFETLIEGFLPLELILDQMPAALTCNGRHYRCSFVPIEAEEILTGLLVVIDDVTEALQRARAEADQKEQLALYQRLARDRSGLLGFIEEGQHMIDALRSGTASPESLKGHLHTLKGNAGLMGLTLLAQHCHAAEDALAVGEFEPQALAPVVSRWSELRKLTQNLVGIDAHNRLEISRQAVQHLALSVAGGAANDVVVETLTRWQLEPLHIPLERLAEYARALAERLGKCELGLTVSDGALLGDPDKSAALWSSLVHIVRNAVDHGLETQEERAVAGKAPRATLALRAINNNDTVRLEIADDGRGIDWERVRQLASERGLASTSRAQLVEALFQPQLSTRQEVSETSGRGVGLAAVRREISALGGTLEVLSETGQGCCWIIELPAATLGVMGAPAHAATG